MSENIEEIEFSIFDTETTGLEPESGDRIIELAALRIKNKEKLASFHTLINPERNISEEAFLVNRISQDMLKDAPKIKEIIPGFFDFIKDSILCAYNASFDLAFLNQELKLNNYKFPQEIIVIDILKMARRLMPGLGSYALISVAEELKLKKKQIHRALSDVELTFEIFNKLKDISFSKGINDLSNFINLFSINSSFLEDINNQKIAKIQEALDLGVKLKIRYFSRTNAEITEREILPKEIRQEKDKSYLVGKCFLRNEERTFRIDSILHLEII